MTLRIAVLFASMNAMLRFMLLRAFVLIGKHLFGFTGVFSDETGDAKVYFFSDSERDLNIGTREYVEALDESYN